MSKIMDMNKYEFLPDDFEFVGSKQDITKDSVTPSLPAWKDALNRFKKNKGAVGGLVCSVISALMARFAPRFAGWGGVASDT